MIDNTQKNNKKYGGVNHIINKYCKQAQEEYKTKYDRV